MSIRRLTGMFVRLFQNQVLTTRRFVALLLVLFSVWIFLENSSVSSIYVLVIAALLLMTTAVIQLYLKLQNTPSGNDTGSGSVTATPQMTIPERFAMQHGERAGGESGISLLRSLLYSDEEINRWSQAGYLSEDTRESLKYVGVRIYLVAALSLVLFTSISSLGEAYSSRANDLATPTSVVADSATMPVSETQAQTNFSSLDPVVQVNDSPQDEQEFSSGISRQVIFGKRGGGGIPSSDTDPGNESVDDATQSLGHALPASHSVVMAVRRTGGDAVGDDWDIVLVNFGYSHNVGRWKLIINEKDIHVLPDKYIDANGYLRIRLGTGTDSSDQIFLNGDSVALQTIRSIILVDMSGVTIDQWNSNSIE